jgi:RNA polymerase sigma-70 factor (ECF subfamily)
VPNPSEHPDFELLQLLRQNDEKAMAQIFRAHYAKVCLAIKRVIADEHVVEDLAQDVFYDLWRKRASIEITTSLRAYLRRAGVNKTLNYIRDKKIKWDDEDKLPTVSVQAPDAVQVLEGQDLKNTIEQAIDELPERCRLIFSLSRFEDMSYQQIADELDISIKTVENQMSKALKLLRSALAAYMNRR